MYVVELKSSLRTRHPPARRVYPVVEKFIARPADTNVNGLHVSQSGQRDMDSIYLCKALSRGAV
jgi:hypothetical protein